jgi:exosome complex exonuclease DIS3/RRP44
MADETNEKPGFEIYEFVPVDNRFPSFFMRSFNIQSLAKKRIMVEFDDWPNFSKHPLCHFVRIIGDEGSNKAEGDVILLEHNVEIKEFSKKAYECLPEAGDQFMIPPF